MIPSLTTFGFSVPAQTGGSEVDVTVRQRLRSFHPVADVDVARGGCTQGRDKRRCTLAVGGRCGDAGRENRDRLQRGR